MRPIIMLLLVACGDNRSRPLDAPPGTPDATVIDAGVPDAMPPPDGALPPGFGGWVELELLPARPPLLAANHSFETTIAANGDDVVVAYINLSFADESGWESHDDTDKRTAVAASHDGGETFGAPQDVFPSHPMWTTDPVVRATSSGFWFLSMHQTPDGYGIAASVDGEVWTEIAAEQVPYDKGWLAVDDANLWVAHSGSTATRYHRFNLDGTLVTTDSISPGSSRAKVSAAYAAGGAVHFLHMSESSDPVPISRWDGMTAPVFVEELPFGDVKDTSLYYTSSASMGEREGVRWVVRAIPAGDAPAVVVTVGGVDTPVSLPGEHAFLPAGIVDDAGILHVVYYDTAGPIGVLAYVRSRSADWAEGFEPRWVIDGRAAPGSRWFPNFGDDISYRRLREYIDMTITGDRLLVTWTHAPVAPSRVRVARIDL